MFLGCASFWVLGAGRDKRLRRRYADLYEFVEHRQLRDLIIAPHEPGIVNYVVDKGIVEQDMHVYGAPIRHLAHLSFTPNTLAYLPIGENGDTLLAAGGQDREIHVSYYTAAASSYIPILPSSSLQQRYTRTRRKSTKLWEFEEQLTTGSINNSVLLTTMTRCATGMSLTRSNESSVEPRVGISNNDGSVKLYDVPMRVGGFGGHGGSGEDEDEDAKDGIGAGNGLSTRRVLRKVGEVQLGEPINHSSISPDGRMLLSVGDSRRIYLHRIRGGAEVTFESITNNEDAMKLELPAPDLSGLISAYERATAAGNLAHGPSWLARNMLAASFSTAFSDSNPGVGGGGGDEGTMFAVGGQEGVVAVWDVRYLGRPMRVWETDKMRGVPGGWRQDRDRGRFGFEGAPGLLGMGQGGDADADAEEYGSASGWISVVVEDPSKWPNVNRAPGWSVRSVKFGRSGGKEVLAFTEHTSLVHVVDARTFETEDVIRVPTLRHRREGPTHQPQQQQHQRHSVTFDTTDFGGDFFVSHDDDDDDEHEPFDAKGHTTTSVGGSSSSNLTPAQAQARQRRLDAERRRLSAYGKMYYRPDLDIAGMCFDRSGEGGMYVLGVVVPDSDSGRDRSEEYRTPASGSVGANGWGEEDEEEEEEGNEEGRTRKEKSGGAVVEWKIRGARKMRSVDEPGEA
ncbi:hypothetical protein D9613_012078 [Agrocybe pediades]|uniref:DUF2415 domain-containing protein n=1 Tax=Agrocybe pediades TaxID=84607 RepID=A0A8H4R3X1_9AGAR|nr:hypothetical protein D9613_012078 [Agrocybe pediades]